MWIRNPYKFCQIFLKKKKTFLENVYTKVYFNARINLYTMKNIGIDSNIVSLLQLEAEIWQKV